MRRGEWEWGGDFWDERAEGQEWKGERERGEEEGWDVLVNNGGE